MTISSPSKDPTRTQKKLNKWADKAGVSPEEFLTILVHEFCGDLTDQILECLSVSTKLTKELSAISPQRAEDLAIAFNHATLELSRLRSYLTHLKAHPLDWPELQ